MSKLFNKKNVVINLVWKLLERFLSVFITIVTQIILARLLNPEDFGLVAIVSVFLAIVNVFVLGGPSSALIQRIDTDELDYSSMFWINLIVSTLLYVILFIFSPHIAIFFKQPELKYVFRILGISIIIYSVNSIQRAYISKNMLFRYHFFSTIIGKILSGLIGVSLAIFNYGIWALVFQSLTFVLFETIILWIRLDWKPKLIFSYERLINLFPYTFRVSLMSFIESISEQFRKIVIGRIASTSQLAFYDKGFIVPSNIVTNVSSSLREVMFPLLSNYQKRMESILIICRRWISVFSYLILPILIFIIAAAESIVIILFTEKWLPMIPFLRLACISYFAWIIEVPVRETIKSMGFADIVLRLQVIKTIIAILLLFLFLPLGIKGIALSSVFSSFFNLILSIYYGTKYIGYKLIFFIKDLGSSFFINLCLGMVVYMLAHIGCSHYAILAIQIVLGISVYLLLSIITENKSFIFIINILRKIFKSKVSVKK